MARNNKNSRQVLPINIGNSTKVKSITKTMNFQKNVATKKLIADSTTHQYNTEMS